MLNPISNPMVLVSWYNLKLNIMVFKVSYNSVNKLNFKANEFKKRKLNLEIG